jgi:hypothetical protein
MRWFVLALMLSGCAIVTHQPFTPPVCEPPPEPACLEWALLDFGKDGGMYLRPACLLYAGPRDPFFIPDVDVMAGLRICLEV